MIMSCYLQDWKQRKYFNDVRAETKIRLDNWWSFITKTIINKYPWALSCFSKWFILFEYIEGYLKNSFNKKFKICSQCS